MAKMNISAAFTPAFQHVARVLFRPFALKKWLGLGFVSMLAYQSGGPNFNFPSSWGDSGGDEPSFPEVWAWMTDHALLVIAICAALVALMLLIGWLYSVMTFVYTDQIVRSSGAVREPFARLKRLGNSYFLFTLAFAAIAMLALAVLVGLPLVWVFAIVPHATAGAKVIAVVIAIVLGIPILIAASVIGLFSADFVIPAMYARGVRVMDGWRIVLPVLRANIGQSVLYVLMSIALGIAMTIAMLIVILITGLAMLLPVAILALLGYAIYLAFHVGWTTPVAAVVGVLAVAVGLFWSYLIMCAMQPVLVFRRSFALIVIGQAEPSLITVPIGPAQAFPTQTVELPPTPPEPESGESPGQE